MAASSRRARTTAGSPAYLTGLLLRDRKVVVVGGGCVARRRVPKLLDAGARVEVISPEVHSRLAGLAEAGAITWHARFAYDKEKTDEYNERPWGAGFGVSRWDDKGNWHGLYLMAFKDSFNKWEPIAGYGWEKTWRPLADDNFHLGLGYTLGVTARDNWNYIPLPVVLPMASIGYGPATFQMTYIPGTYNNGNVYFAWARFQF